MQSQRQLSTRGLQVKTKVLPVDEKVPCVNSLTPQLLSESSNIIVEKCDIKIMQNEGKLNYGKLYKYSQCLVLKYKQLKYYERWSEY